MNSCLLNSIGFTSGKKVRGEPSRAAPEDGQSSGKQAKDFRAGKAEKVVDNEELAQNWLSFIGYSKEAINERREIFSPERTDLYRLCFLLTPDRHGYHYSYRLKDGADASAKNRPRPAHCFWLSFQGNYIKRLFQALRTLVVKQLQD